jgi:hypothetical protein
MFRASLRPSSGGRTAFHCLWFSVKFIVVTLESRVARCVHGDEDVAWNILVTVHTSLFASSNWSQLHLLIEDAWSSEQTKKTILLISKESKHLEKSCKFPDTHRLTSSKILFQTALHTHEQRRFTSKSHAESRLNWPASLSPQMIQRPL